MTANRMIFLWMPIRAPCVLTPYARTRRAHPRKPRALAEAAVAAVVGGEAADPFIFLIYFMQKNTNFKFDFSFVQNRVSLLY